MINIWYVSRSGLIAGIILAWTRAIAEFGAVLLFCGTFAELPSERFSALEHALKIDQADWLSVAVWSQIEYGNVEYGFALACTKSVPKAISGKELYGGRTM